MHDWDADTRVDATGDGRFAAEVADRWSGTGGRPDGGYPVTRSRRLAPVPAPPPTR